MRATQDAFRSATAQGVEKIHMTLRREHYEIATPVRPGFEDLVYYLTSSYDCFKGPTAAQRQINGGCRLILSCNVN